MVKNINFDDTMDRMLESIPEEYDKRETSIIYQALAMIVPELILLQSDIDLIESEAFPDTCNYNNLVRFASLRNIYPRPATKGIVVAEFNIDVEIGARFNCEERNYEVFEKIETGKYKLIAEEIGHIESIGDLTPMDDVTGLKSAKITKILTDGREVESIDSLRKRYMDSLNSQAFGGNRADYIEKVTSIDGVGACKVFRRAKAQSSEIGKIRIVIVDSTFKDVSTELIETVSKTLVPNPNDAGGGQGLAPIGHQVEVVGVGKEIVNIRSKITLDSKVQDIERDLKEQIEEYFDELRSNFGNDEVTTVRISAVENKILGIRGVIDVSGTTLNGYEKNLEVDAVKIPILGAVNYDRV